MMKFNFDPLSVTSSKHHHRSFSKIVCIVFSTLFMASTVGFGQPVSYFYSSPGRYIWTCPVGVTTAIVECFGAGGAGGGAIAGPNDTAGGGGGGGAYVIDTLTVIPYANYALNIGGGGSAAAGANGGAGGDSWFNSPTTVFAAGGKGGFSGLAGFGSGGAGGAASSCIPSANAFSGGHGTTGTDSSGLIISGTGGVGVGAGGVTGGIGGAGVAGVTGAVGGNGWDGGLVGGGGGGGLAGNDLTTAKGGNGAAGQVVITYISDSINAVVNFHAGNGFNAVAFPNPTNGKTTVQFYADVPAVYKLKVFDITGRELINKEGRTEEGINFIGLDMNGYSTGIYLLHLQCGDSNKVIKLIVQQN